MSTNLIHYEEDKLLNPKIGDLAETRSGRLVQILDFDVFQLYDHITGSIASQTRYVVMPVDGLSSIFSIFDVYKPATPMYGEEKFVFNGNFLRLFN